MVIVIGALSPLVPDAFPRATVWSTFGSGYLFIPLILPPLALCSGCGAPEEAASSR